MPINNSNSTSFDQRQFSQGYGKSPDSLIKHGVLDLNGNLLLAQFFLNVFNKHHLETRRLKKFNRSKYARQGKYQTLSSIKDRFKKSMKDSEEYHDSSYEISTGDHRAISDSQSFQSHNRDLLSYSDSQPDDKKYDLRYRSCAVGELNTISVSSLRSSSDSLKISYASDNPLILILEYKANPFASASQYRVNFSLSSDNVKAQLESFFSNPISYDSTKNVYKCVESNGNVFYFGVNVTQALGSAPTYSVFTRIEDSQNGKVCDNSNGFFASPSSASIATSNLPTTTPLPVSQSSTFSTSLAPTSQFSSFSTSQASSSQLSSLSSKDPASTFQIQSSPEFQSTSDYVITSKYAGDLITSSSPMITSQQASTFSSSPDPTSLFSSLPSKDPTSKFQIKSSPEFQSTSSARASDYVSTSSLAGDLITSSSPMSTSPKFSSSSSQQASTFSSSPAQTSSFSSSLSKAPTSSSQAPTSSSQAPTSLSPAQTSLFSSSLSKAPTSSSPAQTSLPQLQSSPEFQSTSSARASDYVSTSVFAGDLITSSSPMSTSQQASTFSSSPDPTSLFSSSSSQAPTSTFQIKSSPEFQSTSSARASDYVSTSSLAGDLITSSSPMSTSPKFSSSSSQQASTFSSSPAQTSSFSSSSSPDPTSSFSSSLSQAPTSLAQTPRFSPPITSIKASPSPAPSIKKSTAKPHITSAIQLPDIKDCDIIKKKDSVILAFNDNFNVTYFESPANKDDIFDLDNFTKDFQQYCEGTSSQNQNFLEFLKSSLISEKLPGLRISGNGSCQINVDKESFNQAKINKFAQYLNDLSLNHQLNEDQKKDYQLVIDLFGKVTNSSISNKDLLCPVKSDPHKTDYALIGTLAALGAMVICVVIGCIHSRNKNRVGQSDNNTIEPVRSDLIRVGSRV